MDERILDTEFLRPLHESWMNKLEAAYIYRKRWKEVADECVMFYGRSASAMWSDDYTRKVWKGVKPPKFRITVNKAFELVAIFQPNLMWSTPHRTVTPKKPFLISDVAAQSDPQVAMMAQMLQAQQTQFNGRDMVTAEVMQRWLNYCAREVPHGGLAGQSERATVDALIKGRGVMAVRPYMQPGSGKMMVGSFRVDPEDLLTDPDFKTLGDSRWISIRHIEPHYEVEERFKLPPGSLKEKTILESRWQYSELMTTMDSGIGYRKSGQANDLCVWYECFSLSGCGARNTSMESFMKDHLERTVGRQAYIAICPNVPYPLNCPSSAIRNGATDEEVRQRFSWPIPSWKDSKWPIETLDFYIDPDCSWPIAPLQPAMGELKLLNFLIPWLANRVWSSSRDFWAVAGPHIEHYKKHILEGDDQSILPVPPGTDDVRKSIQILQQPETRQDLINIIQFFMDQFDKRTGLMATAYGGNEGGTQNRTAEETASKQRAVGVRPEFMQNQMVSFQSRLAQLEAYVSRLFVKGSDVSGLMGPAGQAVWDMYIGNQDEESIIHQFEYTIEAASIRRPNRDRDIGNFQQILQTFGPILQQYAATSGDYGPINFLMDKWAEFHDADLSGAAVPPPQPNPQAEQMQLQQQQLQIQQMAAMVEKTKAEAARSLAQAQQDPGKDAEFESVKAQMDLAMQIQEHDVAIEQGKQTFVQEFKQDQLKFQQDMAQQKALSAAKVAAAKAAARAKPKATPKPKTGKK